MTNDTQPFYTFLILAGALFVGFIVGGTAQIAAATSPITTVSAPSGIIQTINAVHEADQKTKAAANLAAQSNAREQQAKPATNDKSWNLDVGRSLSVGIGAVIGIMAFNFVTSGTVMGSAVAAIGRVGTQVAIAESSVTTAISIYGIVSAVMGAAIGNNLYSALQSDSAPSASQLTIP